MKTPSNRTLSRNFIAIAAFAALPAHATNGTWNQTAAATYTWNTPADWGGTTPNAIADTATLNTALAGNQIIGLGSTNVTLGSLSLGATTGTFTYTLQTGTFTLNNNGGGAAITELSNTSGGDTISAAIVLADSLSNTIASSSTLATSTFTISGGITGAQTLTLAANNAGNIKLSGTINNTGTVTNSGTGSGTVSITSAFGANVTTVNQNSANSTLNVNAGNSADTITYNINSGTMTVSNSNSIGAKSTVNFANTAGATLALGSTGGVNIGALTGGGTTGGTLTHSGTFNVDGTNINATFNGNENGQGDITFSMTGTQTLGGTWSYTGNSAFNVSSGLVVIASTGTIGTTANTVYNYNVTGSGNLTISSGAAYHAGTSSTVNSSGTVTVNGTFTGGQGASVTAGTLLIGSTGTYGVGQGLTDNGGTITEASGGVLGLTGFLIGNGVTVTNGTMTLNSGSNVYTSGTTVNQGLLQIGANAPVSATGALGNSNGSVTLGANTSDSSGTLTGAATILTDTGGITIARSISERTGTLTTTSFAIGGNQTSGTSTYTGAISLTHATTLTSAAGGAVNFNNAISGTQNVTISGGGLVLLTGTSTFGGSGNLVTVQGGTLTTLNAGSNLGSALNVLAFNGGTYQFASGSNFDLSARTIGFLSGGGTIDTNGNTETFTSAIGNGGTGSYTGGLTLNDSVGTGTLILAAANTYTGTTTVAKGTLVTTAAGALGNTGANSLAVNTGGNLDLHGTSQNVGNLSGTGGFIYNNGSGTSTLTIGNGNAGGGSYAGVIENNTSSGGTTALTKTGTGTIGLTGSNTYTGATTVSQGVLSIGGTGSLGGTAVTVTGGTLGIGLTGSTATTTIGTSGAGSLNLNGGTLSFSNGINSSNDTALKVLDINSSTGGTALTLNGGTINIGVGGSGGSDEIVLGTGVSLLTSLSGTTTINLNILTTLNGSQQELIAYGTGGTTGSGVYQLGNVTGNTGGFSLALVSNSTGLFLNESAVSFAYWKGGGGSSWGTISNFTTDSGGVTPRSAALDNQTTVTFNATGGANYANTTLDSSPTINNLVYNVGGVGIGSGSGTNSLTIAGATGIMVNSGLGAVTETISANVVLGGSQTWTVSDAASTLAVSGNISGAGSSLLKAGSGTLVLSGANSYSGATQVLGGYLNIQSSDALDDTTGVTVNSGAALQLQGGITTNGNTSLTINGTGPGTAGALESISDGDSYTGTISLGSASSIGSDAGLFTLTGPAINNNGFTLTLVGAGNGDIYNVIGGSGGLTMSGTGTWSLEATNTYAGTTTINAGTLQLGSPTSPGGITPTLGTNTNTLAMNGGTLDLYGYLLTVGNLTGSSGTVTSNFPGEIGFTLGNNNTNASFGGTITNGDGGLGIIDLTKTGTGTQTLTGSNSYTGFTSISQGALNIAGSNALSANTTATVSNGAALQLSGNITTAAVPLSLVGTGVGGGALENVSGSNTYTGSITLAGNTSIGADALSSLTLSTGGVAMGGSNLTLVGAGTGTISDTISGSGNLAMSGTGTWTLSGSNAYTGTTSVTAGTLVYTKSSALSHSAAINLGAIGSTTLNYAGTGATMATTMNFSGTGTATLGNIGTGSITYSGPLTFASGNTTIALGNITDTIGGTIGNITNGATGSVSLLKQGALNSTWILTGSNTYTGQTTITGGVLQVASLPTGNIDLNGTSTSDYGVLQVVGTETLTNNLGTGAGQIQWLSNGGFSAVSGTMTLNLAGGQTLVWGGGGATNIAGGGGGNIAFGSSTANGVVILQNNINLNSSNDSYTQNVYVQGDTVFFQGAIFNGTDGTGTFNAAPGLNKLGSGTLVLTNANSNYRGSTAITGGTLVAEASSTITLANSTGSATGVFGNGYGPVSSNLTGTATFVNIILGQTVVNGGAVTTGGVINPTLLVGSPTVGGATSISNPVTVDWNNGTGQVYGIGGFTDSNNTFAGQITLTNTPGTGNSFAVTQVATTGTDALNITGGITASNAVTGTVNFANVGAVNVSTNGISNGSGASVISVTQAGTGTTTFSAANTYTGSTTVNAGLLRINGSLVAGSAVTVNTGGALGGTGTISGAVSINSGGAINLADGTIGTLTVGSLTLGTGSTAMTFDIGAGATNNLDSIANLGALTINGTSAITIGFVSGSPTLTAGTYSLITGPITGTQFSDFSLTDATLGNYAFSLVNGGASGLELMVTSNLAPTTYFYTGTTSTDFTDYHNFNTGASTGTVQTVGLSSTSDVTIGTTSPTPGNLTPVANSNISINSLTFASSGSGATLSGTGTVTIAAGSGTGITDSTGISTGTETISTALVLGANQSWSATSNSTLKVTGAISGAQSLALTGAGTYRLGGANTFQGLTVGTGSDTPTVYLANGTNGSATGTTTFTVKAGATIGGNGTSSGTSFNIAGTGTATSARANVLVGLTSLTDTNTTGVLTLKGSTGTSVIADTNLTFNLNATSTSSTQLNLGATNLAFGTDSAGSVKLTLDMQNEPAIVAANTLYTLIAGTGSTSITPGSSTGQYTGLTLGTTTTLGSVTETKITGNNLQLAFGSQVDSSYYANGSYLVLYQSAGVDDIDVVVVPEPGTWAMMIGGLAALLFWQRRRSKS